MRMATPREKVAAARGAHVALFDATTLLGKGVKERLVERRFPVESVHLYTSSADPDANLSEYGGEAMVVKRPDIDALGPLDIAFYCGTRPEGALYVDWPDRRGFVAIDLTTASRDAARVPVVNATVNPETLPDGAGLVRTPHPIALVLSTVLAAVERDCGLRAATAVVMQPASESGEEGIGELYQQTLGLLNFGDLPRDIFGRQLAFNLVPGDLYGTSGPPGGGTAGEIEKEILTVLGSGLDLSIAVVLAPVFHCHAAMMRIVLPQGKGRDDLQEALGKSGEIRVEPRDGRATPIECAGEPGILVTGIRPAGDAGAFWLWIVSDNLQSGSALNAVRIAEALWRRGAPRKGEA
jgi:aspartate-semialdehyde dehydrogenase